MSEPHVCLFVWFARIQISMRVVRTLTNKHACGSHIYTHVIPLETLPPPLPEMELLSNLNPAPKPNLHYTPNTTVKTAIYNLCGQRPPCLYDRNSMHRWFCTEKSLWWVTTCWTRTWPATTRFCTQSHSSGVWDYYRVHMYLFVGLCKLGTTFCVNFEQQTCKTSVYTATSALWLFGKWLPLGIWGEEKCWLCMGMSKQPWFHRPTAV